jgi:uroporphyrinogen decarboxylase
VTSRDRVEAARALDVADRPPVGVWGHDYGAEWSPRALADVHVAAQRRYGWDFVKFQPRATCFAEAFGADFRRSTDPDSHPDQIRPAIEVPEDLASLEAVSATVPPLADQVEGLRLTVEALGPDVPVIQTVFSPLSVADFLQGWGEKAIVPVLRDRPELVQTAMAQMVPTLIEFARASVAAGAAGVFFGVVGMASADVLSAEEYEALVLPFDLQVLEALPDAAWFTVVHLCGPGVHFELARRMPARAVSWSIHDEGNPSLADGLAAGGKAVLGGVAQRTTLQGGPVKAIEAEVRAAAGADGGRGVLVGPGCSIPPRTPPDHLRAMAGAAGILPA